MFIFPTLKIYVPHFHNCSLLLNFIFNKGNCFPNQKNIVIKWSQISTDFCIQIWEHVPETEICVPCISQIEK